MMFSNQHWVYSLVIFKSSAAICFKFWFTVFLLKKKPWRHLHFIKDHQKTVFTIPQITVQMSIGIVYLWFQDCQLQIARIKSYCLYPHLAMNYLCKKLWKKGKADCAMQFYERRGRRSAQHRRRFFRWKTDGNPGRIAEARSRGDLHSTADSIAGLSDRT